MNLKQRKEGRKEGRDLEFSNLEERKKRSRILNLKQRKEEISNLVIQKKKRKRSRIYEFGRKKEEISNLKLYEFETKEGRKEGRKEGS